MQKIHTIFKRDYSDTYQVLNEINPACQWVFDGHGQAYRKFQGMAALIYQGKLYKRSIIKQNQIIPTEFIYCTYDHQSGKAFGWMPVSFIRTQDKYYAEAFEPNLPNGTYELIGPKIMGNPENYSEHKLVKHTSWPIELPERTYNKIKTFLSQHDYEGIVFRRVDGKMAKIKKKDFGLKRALCY